MLYIVVCRKACSSVGLTRMRYANLTDFKQKSLVYVDTLYQHYYTQRTGIKNRFNVFYTVLGALRILNTKYG